MFTAPLTLDEYRLLVDVKYGPESATIVGWALSDSYGRIHGWHPREPGSRNWAHPDDAFRAFVPDSRHRRHLALRGHAVTATTGIEELAALLRQARGEPDPNPPLRMDTAQQ